MKSLETSAIITSISSKVDGSLRLGVGTPELSPEEKVVFMSLQNQNVKMTIEPEDKPEELVKVEKGLDGKSPSERLYNTIFVYYKSVNSQEDWQAFYKRNIEHVIDTYKAKLPKEY